MNDDEKKQIYDRCTTGSINTGFFEGATVTFNYNVSVTYDYSSSEDAFIAFSTRQMVLEMIKEREELLQKLPQLIEAVAEIPTVLKPIKKKHLKDGRKQRKFSSGIEF